MQKNPVVLRAALAVCLGSSLFASPRDDARDIGRLVERSNLVFAGRVQKVTYRVMPGGPGEGPIPYTFATYRIDRVIRGRAPGAEITLRFAGGTDGRGRFLTLSDVPLVQEGDQDLLFVDDTSHPICPLVDCDDGRYRILGEQVFDAAGAPVREIAKGRIVARGVPPPELRTVRFPAPTFGELMQNPEAAALLAQKKMSVAAARREYEKNAPKFIEVTDHYAPDQGEDVARETPELPPVALTALVAAVEDAAKKSARTPADVKSANPNETVVARAGALAPPEEPPAPQVRRSPEDEAEYKALEANKFNPVLPKRRNR